MRVWQHFRHEQAAHRDVKEDVRTRASFLSMR
jgi:hypothetical protein